MEVPKHLNIVRTILAILITVALTLAPSLSAVAADRAKAMTTTISVSADTNMAIADIDMSGCMKGMQGPSGGVAGDSPTGACTCYDTEHECLDTANCMTKCCKVIGAMKPAGKMPAVLTIAYRQAEPAKPPDWVSAPPAPPPRS